MMTDWTNAGAQLVPLGVGDMVSYWVNLHMKKVLECRWSSTWLQEVKLVSPLLVTIVPIMSLVMSVHVWCVFLFFFFLTNWFVCSFSLSFISWFHCVGQTALNLLSGWLSRSVPLKCNPRYSHRKINRERRKAFENSDRRTEAYLIEADQLLQYPKSSSHRMLHSKAQPPLEEHVIITCESA